MTKKSNADENEKFQVRFMKSRLVIYRFILMRKSWLDCKVEVKVIIFPHLKVLRTVDTSIYET